MYMQSGRALLFLVVQDSEDDRPHSARTHNLVHIGTLEQWTSPAFISYFVYEYISST